MELIAETAWHHEGDFDFFQELVSELSINTQADYIKLHMTFDFDEYMSSDHAFYDSGKKWIFSEEQWKDIIDIVIKKKKLLFLYNDRAAVRFGQQYDPDLIEIHSVCLNDIKLLDSIKNQIGNETGIVIGVGGSTLYEIDHAVNYLDRSNIVLMHGFQSYPTKFSIINFRKMKKIMSLYPDFKHGYADHTGWDEPNNTLITLFGAAQGVSYVEKHVTIVPGKMRTDWSSTISIDMFNDLYEKIQILNRCMGSGELDLSNPEKLYSIFGPMKKAAMFSKDVKENEIFTVDMIEFKRTAKISNMSQIEAIQYIGKKIVRDNKRGEILMKEDFANEKDNL